MVKRKTPSELRGEQSKREDLTDDDEVSPSAGSAKDTQLIGEVFSAKKSMFRIVSKEQISSNLKNEKFLGAADLSSSAVVGISSSGAAATAGIDMGQALKGLASLVNSTEPTIAGGNSFSGCHINIPGKNAPLDLTLKTSMRIVFSPASANWNENIRGFKDLHSWMYPQCAWFIRPITELHNSIDLAVRCGGCTCLVFSCSISKFCYEMTRAEDIAQGSSNALFYSIEIEDAIVPPWIICSICALMMGSQGRRNFEASFVTEPLSIGLNVALNLKSTFDNFFGIPKAVVTSSLSSCTLKSVNYCDGSYIASLSPVV